MGQNNFKDFHILWIEEQFEEYDPLLVKLQDLIGKGNVEVVRTVEESMIKLENNVYDLLLMDIMLPHNERELSLSIIHLKGGLQILQRLRENTNWKTNRNCKVIVLTARGNSDALNEVRELLNNHGDLLEKPTPIETIIKKIETILLGFKDE